MVAKQDIAIPLALFLIVSECVIKQLAISTPPGWDISTFQPITLDITFASIHLSQARVQRVDYISTGLNCVLSLFWEHLSHWIAIRIRLIALSTAGLNTWSFVAVYDIY